MSPDNHSLKQYSQRRIIAGTVVFVVAASLGSRVYFDGPGGFVAPFMATALLLPSGRLFTVFAFWALVLIVGVVAWFRPSLPFAFAFSIAVVLLVLLGEFAAYQFAHGG